jgi:hypothetical protein
MHALPDLADDPESERAGAIAIRGNLDDHNVRL